MATLEVIVDNGSSDNSRAVLERFADEDRATVRLHDHKGSIAANEAMRLARGKRVPFVFSRVPFLFSDEPGPVYASPPQFAAGGGKGLAALRAPNR